MARFLHRHFSFTSRKCADVHLACSWLLGLGCGGLLFRYAEGIPASLMNSAAAAPVSIVSLLICVLFPFLLSAIAAFLGAPGLILPVCFLKACCFCFVSCGFRSAYGSGGWLVWLLAMFSDICGCCLLYFFWQRYTLGYRHFSRWTVPGFCLAACAIAVFDFRYIAPVLQGVLS